MATQAILAQIAAAEPFAERVRLALVARAVTVHASGAATAAERGLIQRLMRGQWPALGACLGVVAHPDIAPGTYALDGSDIPDEAITAAVAALWPVLAGAS